jgi:hypothetical protein
VTRATASASKIQPRWRSGLRSDDRPDAGSPSGARPAAFNWSLECSVGSRLAVLPRGRVTHLFNLRTSGSTRSPTRSAGISPTYPHRHRISRIGRLHGSADRVQARPRLRARWRGIQELSWLCRPGLGGSHG